MTAVGERRWSRASAVDRGRHFSRRLVAQIENVGADLADRLHDLAPVWVDIFGMIPQGAFGRVGGKANIDLLRDMDAFIPGMLVARAVGLAVAPPGELTPMTAPITALLDHLADGFGKFRIGDPVHDHMADGDLAFGGLITRLEIDVEGEAVHFVDEIIAR